MAENLDSQPAHAVPTSLLPGRVQTVEVCVFVFLILPSMVLSFFVSGSGSGSSPSFILGASAITVRDLALLGLVLFFLWRNGESIRTVGWTRDRIMPEIILGIALFIPTFLAGMYIDSLVEKLGLSTPAHEGGPGALVPRTLADFVMAGVLVGVVAVVEETIFRGYLMLRFKAITASTAVAVVLSTALFSVGHGYEGSAGVVTVGFLGFVFAVVYAWRGSVVAPVVMHFLQDFLAIVVVPLLTVSSTATR